MSSMLPIMSRTRKRYRLSIPSKIFSKMQTLTIRYPMRMFSMFLSTDESG